MQPDFPDSEGSSAATDPGRRQRGWRRGLSVAALALGMAGLAASAAGVAAQLLPRTFTAAQQQRITAWQIGRRWRTLPAGKIFPATVSYQLPGYALDAPAELPLTATRVGIGRQASCAATAEAAAGAVLARHGCAAMLRATYLDSTESLLVTVGVAVMPDDSGAAAVASQLSRGPQPRPGVRPLAFPGTLAARFGSRQRQLSWAVSAGPYLILSTVGYADGMPVEPVATDAYVDQEMSSVADGVADAVGTPLGALPGPPKCPGAPGC
jgi:hypothetical protein